MAPYAVYGHFYDATQSKPDGSNPQDTEAKIFYALSLNITL